MFILTTYVLALNCIRGYNIFYITVGSGDLRQMSENPIPHEEHFHCYILRRWRPTFLHPKGEIQMCHRADEQNALKIASPPPVKVQT
jgi:hypothetical protein